MELFLFKNQIIFIKVNENEKIGIWIMGDIFEYNNKFKPTPSLSVVAFSINEKINKVKYIKKVRKTFLMYVIW
ncbi:hypothetical protein [Spiroplasma endosymbiont of Glossina fuscipes fuscipes]|uniref:hypothetical protein n=1 Tax=Spiroplasma endosymbiont of Glossina fuscipes fuscipes TaxID=2004463 RepID=UPI003C761B16